MDLALFDFSKATAVMTLKRPDNGDIIKGEDGKPFTITLKSSDHEDVVAVRDSELDKIRHARMATTKTGRNFTIELLTACTASWNLTWNGKQPECTPENVRKLYAEQPWIREQVDVFVGDRANFSEHGIELMAQTLTFGAMDRWALQLRSRATAIFRESVQEVVSIAQTPVAQGGNMPVDTGWLRASIRGSNESMPQVNPSAKAGPATYDPGQIILVIAGTELGQPLYIGYTAAYAAAQEFGTSKMPPRAFVALAATQWPQIVNANIERAKQRAA